MGEYGLYAWGIYPLKKRMYLCRIPLVRKPGLSMGPSSFLVLFDHLAGDLASLAVDPTNLPMGMQFVRMQAATSRVGFGCSHP